MQYPTQLAEATRIIAIQGVQGSFHEIAARKFFGDSIGFSMCDSFPDLFQSLRGGEAAFGVVAIENTVAGTLMPNYALLRESSFQVIGEVYLRIEQHLMALPGQQLADIREVHSHPMALQQCLKYLSGLQGVKLVESVDTAASAAWIRAGGIRGMAAIGSELAARTYGLEILAPGIETNKRNFTRFLVIASPEAAQAIPRETTSKASLCFNLAHAVGSLAQILLILSAHGMNLTKIQSLPIVGREWEYFFHIDLEYDDYEQYRRSLAAIRPQVQELRILGEYARGSKPQEEAA